MYSIRLNPMELSSLLVGRVESSNLTEVILIYAIPVTEMSPSLSFLSTFLTEPQSPPPQNGSNLPHKWCCSTVSVRQCVWKASSIALNK